MASQQDLEHSLNIIIGMLQVFSFGVYALLVLRMMLSFVIPYVTRKFGILPVRLLKPFSALTSVGESILAQRVYRDCEFSIYYRDIPS